MTRVMKTIQAVVFYMGIYIINNAFIIFIYSLLCQDGFFFFFLLFFQNSSCLTKFLQERLQKNETSTSLWNHFRFIEETVPGSTEQQRFCLSYIFYQLFRLRGIRNFLFKYRIYFEIKLIIYREILRTSAVTYINKIAR